MAVGEEEGLEAKKKKRRGFGKSIGFA